MHSQLTLLNSTNQSNFCSANIPSKVRLSGATTESVFNSKIEEKYTPTPGIRDSTEENHDASL